MICSGTSVRSARRRRGAKPLAVAAAAIRVGEDAAASQQPSVAAAAEFRNGPPRFSVYRLAVLNCVQLGVVVLPLSVFLVLVRCHPDMSCLSSSTGTLNTSMLDYMKKLKNNAFVRAVFDFSLPWRRSSSTFARSWTCQCFTTPNTAGVVEAPQIQS